VARHTSAGSGDENSELSFQCTGVQGEQETHEMQNLSRPTTSTQSHKEDIEDQHHEYPKLRLPRFPRPPGPSPLGQFLFMPKQRRTSTPTFHENFDISASTEDIDRLMMSGAAGPAPFSERTPSAERSIRRKPESPAFEKGPKEFTGSHEDNKDPSNDISNKKTANIRSREIRRKSSAEAVRRLETAAAYRNHPAILKLRSMRSQESIAIQKETTIQKTAKQERNVRRKENEDTRVNSLSSIETNGPGPPYGESRWFEQTLRGPSLVVVHDTNDIGIAIPFQLQAEVANGQHRPSGGRYECADRRIENSNRRNDDVAGRRDVNDPGAHRTENPRCWSNEYRSSSGGSRTGLEMVPEEK